ncbi:MAG: hypothetical protein J0H31_21650, partial [Alphaproteobacteria bacterium]|nr:hypothetical protein [Alphaproteobacteria bacterium]
QQKSASPDKSDSAAKSSDAGAGETSKTSKPQTKFYLRKDRFEAPRILFSGTMPDATGASFSWSNDYLAKTKSLTVQAYLTGAPPGLQFATDGSADQSPIYLASYAFAPYIYLNGKLAYPFKSSERSAAQFGINGEFQFLSGGSTVPLFTEATLSLSPYFQTDFRGRGRLYGADGLLELYSPTLHLGSAVNDGRPHVFGFSYWRLIAEANPLHVEDAGQSNFVAGKDYTYVGATIQARTVLFANMTSVPHALCGRISLLGSYQYFWDLSNQTEIHNLHAEADYDLSGKSTPARLCDSLASGGDITSSGGQSLGASLAFTYDDGIDKATLEKSRKFGANLTIQY